MNTIRLNGRVNPETQKKISELAETEKTITQGLIIEIALNWLFNELKNKSLLELYADYITGGVSNE